MLLHHHPTDAKELQGCNWRAQHICEMMLPAKVMLLTMTYARVVVGTKNDNTIDIDTPFEGILPTGQAYGSKRHV